MGRYAQRWWRVPKPTVPAAAPPAPAWPQGGDETFQRWMRDIWQRPVPGRGPQPWREVDPRGLVGYQSFLRQSGFGDCACGGDMFLGDLPVGTSTLNLVPVGASPFQLPQLSAPPTSMRSSKYDVWVGRILGTAQAALPVVQGYVQTFRRPDGSVQTYVTQPPTTDVSAQLQTDKGAEFRVSKDMLLIGGLALALFVLGSKRGR